MADLSLLGPSGRKKKGRRMPAGMPSTFYANRGGRMVPIGPDEEPITIVRYTPEFPFGRVYLPGGGRAIAPYGRSYPLPEALTELWLSKGVRSPVRQVRRLSGNPKVARTRNRSLRYGGY